MNVPELRFRLADISDAPMLGEFMARNFRAAYQHCSTPENIDRAVEDHYGEPAQRRQIGDPHRINLIASVADDCIAHAQLHIGGDTPTGASSSPAIELSRFYVDTLHHGHGIAQLLMARVKQESRLLGAASLWLSVWQESPQAIRFYEKEGFRRAGSLVFMIGDDPKDDWLMVCSLR